MVNVHYDSWFIISHQPGVSVLWKKSSRYFKTPRTRGFGRVVFATDHRCQHKAGADVFIGKISEGKIIEVCIFLQNGGLIFFLIDGYFVGNTARFIFYAVLVLGGVICWLLYLYDAFKNRVRKKIELLMKHTFISFLCLLIAILLVPVIYYLQGTRWALLYGTFLFMGWITSIILGKTFKTLPFIIWNGHYKHLSGKVKVPLPKHLYDEGLIVWQFWFFIAALISLAIAIVLQNLVLIRIALGLWVVVSVLYNYNVAKTLMHKTKVLE